MRPNPTPPPTTLLEAELRGRIAGHGPLTLAAYLARCLYDPHLGYYTRGLNFTAAHPQGRDFTTAPLLTPLFGAALAGWVAAQWQRLGAPTPFTLAEAGPGTGALLRDIALALPPACAAAARLHLIETSPVLAARQQQTLAAAGLSATSHLALATLPSAQPLILLANELLDAFPCFSFVQDDAATWQQQLIGTDAQGRLAFVTRPARTPPPLPAGWSPAAGAVYEHAPARSFFLAELRHLLATATGSALLLDYGYTTRPPLSQATLQAVHRHQPVSPLFRPGEADLTVHVDFTAAAATLGPKSCTITDLAPFLLAHGLLTLAEPTITQPTTAAALQRLLHPAEMGSLFKVLAYTP